MNIKTPRLVLRDLDPGDADMIFKGLSDPEVIEFYGVSLSEPKDTEAQMQFYFENERKGTGKFWAVCLQEKGGFIGVGGIYNIHYNHRKGEVGFWLFKTAWGNGYMQEGMEAILQYAFQTLQLHRVEGIVEEENIRCRKAIEKMGFVYEGTLRDAEIKNGRFISLCYYSVINE